MEDGARKPPSYYRFLFCNNYAKYKEEVGYFKVGRWSPCPVRTQKTQHYYLTPKFFMFRLETLYS